MELDHIGIAVKNLEAALALHVDKLGGVLVHRERLGSEGVEIAFVGQTELLASLPGRSGPLARFLDRHGEGLHHVAYTVEILDEALLELGRQGLQVVPGYPKAGSRGMRVAFLQPKNCGGVLIELCERKG